ncbi:MAG: hypothetical protein LBD42_05240 [Desulfovibrio sp.]|jgi:hypothetical protein|nr:hypothetical protein [Desulfovibrio sp.]
MDVFLIACWFFFTCGLFPLVFAGGALRLARPERPDIPLFTLACVVLAPLSISIMLYWLYRAFPGIAPVAVTGCVCALFTVVAVYGRRETGELIRLARRYARAWRGRLHASSRRRYIACFVCILAGLLAYIHMGRPILGNDILEYLLDARVIFNAGDMSVYPLLDSTRTGGLYFPSSHPPGFPLLVAWSYFPVGPDSTVCFRLMTLWHSLSWLGLTATAAGRLRRGAGMAAVVLLLGMPFICLRIGHLEADIARLATFQAAFMLGCLLPGIAHRGWRAFLVCGAGAGLALTAHSISLLLLPMLGGTLLLLYRRDDRFLLMLVTVALPVCLGIGAFHYIANMLYTGVPIHDYVPVWELDILQWHSDLSFIRNLDTFANRLLNGPLSLFINARLYGISGILLLAGYAIFLRSGHHSTMHKILSYGAAMYFLMMLICACADIPLAIKNPRYIATIVPLLLPSGAAGLTLFLNSVGKTAFYGKPAVQTAAHGAGLCILAGVIALTAVAGGVTFSQPLLLLRDGDKALVRATVGRPEAAVIRAIDALVGKDVRILSGMQPLVAFYTDKASISEHDVRCEPVYRAPGKEEAFAELRRLGVTHIIKAPWNFSMHYRTPLLPLLASPDQAVALGGERGYTLFELAATAPAPPLLEADFPSAPCTNIDLRFLHVRMARLFQRFYSNVSTLIRPQATPAEESAPFILRNNVVWIHVPKDGGDLILRADVSGRGTLHAAFTEIVAGKRDPYEGIPFLVDMGTFAGERREVTARVRLRDDVRALMLFFQETDNPYSKHTLENLRIKFYKKTPPEV